MRSANATAAGLVTVIVGAVAVVGWSVTHRDLSTSAAWREAWAAAAPQNQTPASMQKVALPAHLATLTSDGTAQVWRSRDGRAYLIGKTSIGYKGNWRGVLYGPAPLAPNELYHAVGGRQEIAFDEGNTLFEASVARSRGGGLYEVYFDLN